MSVSLPIISVMPNPAQKGMVLRALAELIYIDVMLRFRRFNELVARKPSSGQAGTVDARDLCEAVDRARVWLLKDTYCLERSLAAVRMLRRLGVPAELVMAITEFPIRGHAWVEVEREVVNDDADYVRALFKHEVARL